MALKIALFFDIVLFSQALSWSEIMGDTVKCILRRRTLRTTPVLFSLLLFFCLASWHFTSDQLRLMRWDTTATVPPLSVPQSASIAEETADSQRNKSVIYKAIRDFLDTASQTVLSPASRRQQLDLLLQFDIIWSQTEHLSYLLHAGTLLGAVRHRGFVPWSDGLSVLIDHNEKHRLGKVFEHTTLASLRRRASAEAATVFFKGHQHSVIQSWPFLRVFIYRLQRNNSTLVWRNVTIATSLVFPLKELSFEALSFPVPRCAALFLQRLFGPAVLWQCCSHVPDRAQRRTLPSKCLPCASVRKYFKTSHFHQFSATQNSSNCLQ